LDRAFNLLLLEAAGNEFGAPTLGMLNGLSCRFWYTYYKRLADLPRTVHLHAAGLVAGEDEKGPRPPGRGTADLLADNGLYRLVKGDLAEYLPFR
jgi:hypothetical protein